MTNYQDKKTNSQRDKQNATRAFKQAGGTIVGFILGLIVGLGIAVGVAMVIQKIPVPFLNKLNKPEKIPELTAGQAADPNKPLYGNKEPAKEAAKDFANESAANPPATEGDKLQPAGKPATEKPKTPDTKAADVKPADIKQVQSGPPKPEGVDEKWIYYLQAGAFREQVDADSTKARLALAGFEATISERTAESGSLYRVRIGPFNQLELMNRARAKLSDNGMDVAVIRIAK